MAKTDTQNDLESVVEEKLAHPSLFKVLLLNDDYTPMDFVVQILESVFHMNADKAHEVMMQVHQKGLGVCGTYTFEIAEAKCATVLDLAKKHEHPLQCTIEEE